MSIEKKLLRESFSSFTPRSTGSSEYVILLIFSETWAVLGIVTPDSLIMAYWL